MVFCEHVLIAHIFILSFAPHSQFVGIESARQLPLAMGHTPFGGTGRLGGAGQLHVIGDSEFSFAHAEAMPGLGQYFPEVCMFICFVSSSARIVGALVTHPYSYLTLST